MRKESPSDTLGSTIEIDARQSIPDLDRNGRRRGYRPEPDSRAAQRLLLTVEEAADCLCVGRTYMFDLIASGVVPSFQIGRLRRVRREDLERYVASL